MAIPEPKPPLFSVVIPAHNSARWFGEALASALSQGRADVEVVGETEWRFDDDGNLR